jgi:phage gp45-like
MVDKLTMDAMRGMVRRVTFKNVKDDGQTQTASVEVADGVWRDDVEIMQPFGLASNVPSDGGLALAFAIGGDQGDIAILPVSNPSKRLGKLNPGESGIYNMHGDKMVIGADGSIQIKAGANATITIGGVTVLISDAGVFVTGGRVDHDGKNIGKDHHHEGVTTGADQTGDPLP